jgi:PTH1 family peptidyl-tRNA hydrolase
MFLIVGLGNPGKFYKNNRHNIGYKILDNIRELYNFPDFSKKFKSEFSKSEFNKNIFFLLKPTTFMNNSGIALKEIKDFYNIDINNIYVIHDEIDLDQGRVKVKNGGGHNGHNGLKSIDKYIGKNYNRVRVGVSRPSKIYKENVDENISNWVLSDFTSDEKKQWLDKTIIYVSEMIASLIINQSDLCDRNE